MGSALGNPNTSSRWGQPLIRRRRLAKTERSVVKEWIRSGSVSIHVHFEFWRVTGNYWCAVAKLSIRPKVELIFASEDSTAPIATIS